MKMKQHQKSSKHHIYFLFKRFFDLLFSFIFFIILLPLFIILLILNAIFEKGNPFYQCERVGKDNKIFNLLKFRSMVANADNKGLEILNENQRKQFEKEKKISNDPRITKFGYFLRKTSLDELPQLLNILVGQMSFIGPRPIVYDELLANYTVEEQKILTSCRPGLISLWGVSGRNLLKYENGLRQKIELNYFNKISLMQDIKIFFKAIPAVLKAKGAN